MTENRGAAGNLNEIPERILADLHRARKGHMAEKEQAENQARYRLRDITVGRPLARAFGVFQCHTGDDFRTGRRMRT